MVYVRLAKDWTDGNGTAHEAGEMVDVDAGTLAELEASGVVTAWPGPSGGETDWPGPSGGGGGTPTNPDWPGPS
ncbi:MAG TPA: hypothetical protein VFC00_32235 [Micromonosporaceae bacterium]|nr:hypothetical protein [Micromonosporaceae bacterium]